MKFTIDADPFRGETYERLDADDFMFVEAAAVEKVTGHSWGDILERGTGLHKTADVTAALIWVAVKRSRPATTFQEIQRVTWGQMDFEDDEEPAEPQEPDPTPPPDGTDPSPPSPAPETAT